MSSIYTKEELKGSLREGREGDELQLQLTSFFPSLPTSTTFSSLIWSPLEKKAITASGGIRRALPQARLRSRSLREREGTGGVVSSPEGGEEEESSHDERKEKTHESK